MKTVLIFFSAFFICTVVYGQPAKPEVKDKQVIKPEFRCDPSEKEFFLYVVNNKYYFHTISPADVVKTIDPNNILSIAAHERGNAKNVEYAKKTGKYSSRILDVMVMETKGGTFPKALEKKQ